MSLQNNKQFDFILDFIFKIEGLESNNIYDPGGYTILGISYKYNHELVNYLGDLLNKGEKEKVKEIAKEYYYKIWKTEHFDLLIYPLSIYCFDYRINAGKRAIFDLQKVINEFLCENEKIKVDGIIGKETSTKLIDIFYIFNLNVFCRFVLKRIEYYTNLARFKPYKYFLRGWISRSLKLYKLCMENRNKFLK